MAGARKRRYWLLEVDRGSPRRAYAPGTDEAPETPRSGPELALRLFPILEVRTGSAAAGVAARWTGRPIFDLVAEAKAAGQHAAFHARIAGPAGDVLASSVEFVRTAPAAHQIFLALSIKARKNDRHRLARTIRRPVTEIKWDLKVIAIELIGRSSAIKSNSIDQAIAAGNSLPGWAYRE